MVNRLGLPELGIGVGLRAVHYSDVLDSEPPAGWFEIISENFMRTEGRPLRVLDRIAERYPIVMHGVSLSIGSTDPIDDAYLRELRSLQKRCGARWVSDHLCWTGVARINTHDLLPLPYTPDSLDHVVVRVQHVQEFLGRPLVLENPSSYLAWTDTSIPEWEFLNELVRRTGCGLLLDVNNVFVSSYNLGFDPKTYLEAIPYDSVVQIHVAGHSNRGTHLIDTHVGPVSDPVWELYRFVAEKAPHASTLLEWDWEIPSLDRVLSEARRAWRFRTSVHATELGAMSA